MANPYATPKADVTTKATGGSIGNVPTIPTFVAFLLMMFTMGIYSIYWMYNRTKLLNESSTGKKVSMGLVVAMILINVVFLLFYVYLIMQIAGGTITAETLAMVTAVVNLGSLVVLVVFFIWAFSFRKVFHGVLKIEKGNPLWCNAFLVVIFNVLYFNYKINQVKESQPGYAV